MQDNETFQGGRENKMKERNKCTADEHMFTFTNLSYQIVLYNLTSGSRKKQNLQILKQRSKNVIWALIYLLKT